MRFCIRFILYEDALLTDVKKKIPNTKICFGRRHICPDEQSVPDLLPQRRQDDKNSPHFTSFFFVSLLLFSDA